MDPESVRPLLEEFSREMRRHFDVVAENLRSDNRLLAEGIALNSEQITGLRNDVHDLSTRVTRLEVKVNHLDSKFDQLDTKVNELDSKVNQLGGQLREVRVQMASGFSSVKAELGGVDRRVERLEKAS